MPGTSPVTVQTIRGPIDSSELGRTLSHEHLTNGSAGMERVPGMFDLNDAVDRNVAALERVHEAGIRSLIDLTPLDLGRSMALFEGVAERSPVQVICATGVYRWVPAIFSGWGPDEFADYFTTELNEGIEGTGIRAGIIKLAWDIEYRLDPVGWGSPRTLLQRAARGAARAAKSAGVPISCHTLAADQLGVPLLDIFEDEGLDLRAVTIGHSNDTDNLLYLTRLAERGATVGFDRFFATQEQYVAQRSALALAMVRAGHAERTCLGHDASPYMRYAGRPLGEPNADVWLGVPEYEVPWLLEHGATEDDIDAMLVRSIRATFDAAAAMAR